MPEISLSHRAASALAFAGAALTLAIFSSGPAGAAPAGFAPAGIGFAPAQARNPDDITPGQYRSARLCHDLGGDLENDDRVCSNIDINDTFCLVGEKSALPCEGLFRHVNLCNARHNRPALDPFHCAQSCGVIQPNQPNQPNQPSARKALGRECRKAVAVDDAVAPAVRATARLAAEGFHGAAHSVVANAGFTLAFAEIESDHYAVAAAADAWEIQIVRPVAQAVVVADPVAKIVCAGCYPDPVSFSVSFNPVARPAQVQANFEPATGETLNQLNITVAAPDLPGTFAIVSVARDDAEYDRQPGELEIDPVAGTLSGTLSVPGDYVVWAEFASAAGRDSPEFFLGPMLLSLSINAISLSVVDPDDVIANRTPTLRAARGFTSADHPGHPVAVAPDDPLRHKLSDLKSPETERPEADRRFGIYDKNFGGGLAPAWRISIAAGHPIGGPGGGSEAGLIATLDAAVECRGCLPSRISMTLAFEPVLPPMQKTLAGIFNQEGPLALELTLPSGYEFGAVSATIANVNGGAKSLFAVSQPPPDSGKVTLSAADPPAGGYAVAVGIFHENTFGILTVEAAALVAPAASPAADGIPESDRKPPREITVAFGHNGDAHAVTAAADDLSFGALPENPAGFVLKRSADDKTVTFALDGALDSGGVRVAAATLTMISADPNYDGLAQEVEVSIRSLPAPRPPRAPLASPPITAGASFLDLKRADYENGAYRAARFRPAAGAFASEDLTVTADGVVQSARRLTLAGVYGITVLAETPAPPGLDGGFRGVAALPVFVTLLWSFGYARGDGDGTVTARDADGNNLASGIFLPDGALITMTADPSATAYVREWICGWDDFHCDPGRSDRPNVMKDCVVTLTNNFFAVVNFAPADDAIVKGESFESFGDVSFESSGDVAEFPRSNHIPRFADSSAGIKPTPSAENKTTGNKTIVIAEFFDATKSWRKISATSRARGAHSRPKQSRRAAEVADISPAQNSALTMIWFPR